MKITICDLNPAVLAPWRNMGDSPDLVHGSIVDLECDAVVSPANSFGFMDGGVDMAYSTHFGWHVQERVQRLIAKRGWGELLVGSAVVVRTDDKRIPHLIAAPTMRVPMQIADPNDIMLAVRAAVTMGLATGMAHIALPGMGTGCGAVEPGIAARATAAGIRAAVKPLPPPQSWREAHYRHFNLEG